MAKRIKPGHSASRAATPASVPVTNMYRPLAEGNSIPSGSSSGPMAGPPAAPNFVAAPIQKVDQPQTGTMGKRLGGGAKPAAVKANQSLYSNNPPGTSSSEESPDSDATSTGGGGYGQF